MTKRKSFSDFVRRYGKHFWPVRELSGADEPGHRAGACFFNAASRVLTSRESLTYVQSETHAWVIDAEGRVIDPSAWVIDRTMMPATSNYPEAERNPYFGVPFQTEWLRGVVERRGGLFVPDEKGGVLSLPSLELLVFEPDGWQALAAGRTKDIE